jgi:hypothetical protein
MIFYLRVYDFGTIVGVYFRRTSSQMGSVIDLARSFDDNLMKFYFPGIFPHNSLRIRLEREKQVPVKFLYGNRVSYPRGYNNIMSRELELYSADYVLPLLYPDLLCTSKEYEITAEEREHLRILGRSSELTTIIGKHWLGFEVLADFHVYDIRRVQTARHLQTPGLRTLTLRYDFKRFFDKTPLEGSAYPGIFNVFQCHISLRSNHAKSISAVKNGM